MKPYSISYVMDFNVKKPSHIFALIMLSVSFLVFIVLPIFSYFGMLSSTQTDQIIDIPESSRVLFEITLLLFQIIFVIALFIIVPFLWYFLVNRLTLKKMFSRLKLRLEGIDIAFLWGVVSGIAMLVIVIVIGIILIKLGYGSEELSNIPDIEQYFSLPSMFLLITFQPIGEEIFFRGFLLEKIDYISGKKMAILVTAVLFGLAHMSYGRIYPVVIPMAMGIILGVIVVKTKNLYSAIIAHMIFNFTSFVLYIFGQSLS